MVISALGFPVYLVWKGPASPRLIRAGAAAMPLPRWFPSGRAYTFLKGQSWGAKLLVIGGIFFTFATVGFVTDVWNVLELNPWSYVLASAAYGGLVAAGYAIAIGTHRVLIPLAVTFHVLVPRWVLEPLRAGSHGSSAASDLATITHRLQLDSASTMVCVILGYILMIRFIRMDTVRSLRLRTEVALAERIHTALVPPIDAKGPRVEVYGRSEPSGEVGGDLLDMVERDGQQVLLVADVSGHGVSAGAFMGMTKSAIRMKLLSSTALDALLDDLDDVVAQVRSPEMFVTFAAIRFDRSNTAEVALAGHLPILHGRRSSGAIEAIENRDPPLGVAARRGHTSTRVAFEPGDLFVILTDGLTEVSNSKGEQLGVEGIRAALAPRLDRPLAEIYAAVLATARQHGPRTDDQTLLLARVV